MTILFDDELMYRELKAQAAKEGRPAKDVVAEALKAWLRARGTLTAVQREHRATALRDLDDIRSKQAVRAVADDLLAEVRGAEL